MVSYPPGPGAGPEANLHAVPRLSPREEVRVSDWMTMLLVLGVYLALQLFVLPRLGVPT